MAWRLHLTDSVIYRLEVLHGSPDVLCVWVTDDNAAFFNLHTGAALGERTVTPPEDATPEDSGAWADFLATLRAPNDVYLPHIRTPYGTLYRTTDGQHTLYDGGHGLQWQFGGTSQRLGGVEQFTTVKMDTATGAVAALDERGKLHLYRRGVLAATCETGLGFVDAVPGMAVSATGHRIIVTDGEQVLLVDGDGSVLARQAMPYPVGRAALSPDGQTCITADSDTGVIRVYSGDDLTFTHQKFAVDLFADAAPVQLLADVATHRLAVGGLALTSDGTLAFTLEGIVTVSDLDMMQRLPR